ncbi:MAG: hypothetical protein J7L54_01795 [Elusimicrobia bacterium]|nr:hypothetical protein [Elusimicrobiota bacterium]
MRTDCKSRRTPQDAEDSRRRRQAATVNTETLAAGHKRAVAERACLTVGRRCVRSRASDKEK